MGNTAYELINEADLYCQEYATSDNYDSVHRAYLAGAKSRQEEIENQLKAEHTKGELDFVKTNCNSNCKRISELEGEIEEMQKLLEQWYNQHSDKSYTDTFYQDLLRNTEKHLWSDEVQND